MQQEVDIEKKYKKHPDFKKQMDEIENFYNAQINLAIYENLQKLEEKHFFETIQEDNIITILFYGYRVEPEEDVQKLYRLYVRTYDEILRKQIKQYNIIFFNSLCTSNDSFSAFKSIYRSLPRMYYSKLNKIYVVHSTWTVNILDWIVIGILPKLFSRRLEYVKNIEELKKLKLPINFVEKLPQQIINFGNVKQSNGKNLKERQLQVILPKKKKSPFEYLSISIQKYEMSEQKIPRLLKLLLLTFKKNPSLLQNEGIFRKSGNIQEQENLVIQLAKKNQKVLQNADDGYVIAGLIKKFFIYLSEPILPYEFYEKVMQSSGITAQKQVSFAQELLGTLPQLNHRVFLCMVSFMREQVIKRLTITKMTEYNCGVVFAPCFSRPRNPDFADLIGTGKMVKFLTIIFTRFEQIFGCRPQKWDLCRKSSDKTRQENDQQNRASTQSPKRSSNQSAEKTVLNQKQLNT